jgi:hypothetical protein
MKMVQYHVLILCTAGKSVDDVDGSESAAQSASKASRVDKDVNKKGRKKKKNLE